MKLFYDEISGSHDITGEWIVTSMSMILVSDSGTVLHEEHIKNPFVWGGPSLIYTLISGTHGQSDYFDWYTPINEAVINILTKAVEYSEENENDTEIVLVTWNGYDYLHPSLSDLHVSKVAYLLNRQTSSLKDTCVELGFPLASVDCDERVKAIKDLYYSSIKLLD